MKRLLVILIVLSFLACGGNKQVDVAGITPSPFVGCWECAGANDSIQNLSVCIGERGDSLFVAFYWERYKPFYMTGNPLSDSKDNIIPQACLLVPKRGNRAIGRFFSDADCGVALELFSNNTLLFKTEKPVGFWPDSAVMVRKSCEGPVFK